MVGASAVIATRASVMEPFSSVTTAVAPTIAISIWRRYSSRTYALPVPAAGAGMAIATSSSSAAADVRPGPVQRSARPTSRVPLGPWSTATAPWQRSGPPVSIAGDAFITLPPIVPFARVACEPTIDDASAMPVKRSRITGWATIASCVARAPRRMPPPWPSMPSRPGMRWIATIDPGSGFLPPRAPTTRSVPPAIGRAPEASARTASSTLPALVYAATLTPPGSSPRRARASWAAR